MTQTTSMNALGMPGAETPASSIAGQWHGPTDRAVSIRHIRAEDYPLVHEFVRTLSRDTAYKRFMGARSLTDDEIRHWSNTDPSREYTLIGLSGAAGTQAIVGIATCVFESPDNTDFAIVLADAWQGRGLGGDLMLRLIAAARQLGLRKLSGITLSTNVAMLSLARRLGFRTTRLVGAFCNTLSLDL